MTTISLHKLLSLASQVYRFWAQVVRDFYVYHGLTRSASLAYTTLLAFVPLSVIVLSMLSLFPFFVPLSKSIETFVFNNFVPHTGDVVLHYLLSFQRHAQQLSWISFIFLLITAIMMLITMENHLNELWQVERPRRLGFSVLIHWGILTLGPFLLCFSMVLSSFMVFNQLLPFICSVLAYVFLYKTLPGCPVRWRDAFWGGLFTAVLFEVAKLSFIFYANRFSTYEVLYGALATIPLFLIWLYCSALIFLFGGQVVGTLRLR